MQPTQSNKAGKELRGELRCDKEIDARRIAKGVKINNCVVMCNVKGTEFEIAFRGQ